MDTNEFELFDCMLFELAKSIDLVRPADIKSYLYGYQKALCAHSSMSFSFDAALWAYDRSRAVISFGPDHGYINADKFVRLYHKF